MPVLSAPTTRQVAYLMSLELAVVVGPAAVLLLLTLFAIVITIIAIVLTRRYKDQFAVVVVITGAHHTPTCAHKPMLN